MVTTSTHVEEDRRIGMDDEVGDRSAVRSAHTQLISIHKISPRAQARRLTGRTVPHIKVCRRLALI